MIKPAKQSQKDILHEFNTSGICKPDEHYYVSRTKEVEKALTGITKGKYYTLFASRQMGKTTFVYELTVSIFSLDLSSV